jgi:hypothetical protein
MVSWLPLMVMFTIVDRNPISADRSRYVQISPKVGRNIELTAQ